MILPVLVVLLVLVFWFVILQHWQRGVVMLLVYLPFAGAVTLSLYPESYPVLFKDFFFVVPAYLAFWLARREMSPAAKVPPTVRVAMLTLATLVLLQSFNPNLENMMVAAIGSKVWLFYLPLLFLAFELIQSNEDLVRLLRLMVVITWLPCTVGILEWLASMTFGFQETMYAIYGEAAEGATQHFVIFDIGGQFFRIPSTFTFVSQYFGYTLAMLVPAFALSKLDDSMFWRRFASATLWLAVLAAFMSGARAAFLFVPLLLSLTYWLEGWFKGIPKVAFILTPIFFLSLYIAGIDPTKLFDMVRELFLTYSDSIAREGLLDALEIAPFGTGTGMNTGPARYALDNSESFIGIENYYAKAVIELGVVGLLVVVVLFFLLAKHGYKIHSQLRDKRLRSAASVILAFIVTMELSGFKGWQIDLDPINVYFWMFAGILLKLKYLDRPSQMPAEIAHAAPSRPLHAIPRAG